MHRKRAALKRQVRRIKHRTDCYARARKLKTPPLPHNRGWSLCLLLAALLCHALPSQADQRMPYALGAPGWLLAVGSLQVPGIRVHQGYRRHHREDCSATLLASRSGQKANTIITAWHCLEHYEDLSKPITFTLLKGMDGEWVTQARRLDDGGGMHSDWAILRLQQAVSAERVLALEAHPARADPERSITMAGYSRDEGLGEKGERLTYDPACRIVHQGRRDSDSDCLAYRGASGGAVVQLSDEGQPLFAGVISRGDSESLSIFVPVEGFRATLLRFLR